MGVEDKALERRVRIADGRRNAVDHRIEKFRHPFTSFGTHAKDLIGGNAEDLLDFSGVSIGIGGWKIDLVQRGDNLEIVLKGEITIRKCLRLNALCGIDQKNCAFARRQ
ncbi:unannotated protein [freshwater metagenome]|uniref:Unannotated protein n=1 Tax=freshwater metagenome TaxID=449393 RepID=A0A6J6Y6W6_9ZZZZ